MLLTSLYDQKLQFISHKLCPSSSSHGQFRELVFFSRTEPLIFLKRHTRLFAELEIWALLFVSLMTTVLVQSLNKMQMKYVFHNKFSQYDNAYFMNQKTLSLNFKSSRSQMFFKIGVLKNFTIFPRKHLCWSYFLVKLQAWRSAY